MLNENLHYLLEHMSLTFLKVVYFSSKGVGM